MKKIIYIGKKVACLLLVITVSIVTFPYVSAAGYKNMPQTPVVLNSDGDVKVYQSTGAEGYVYVPIILDRFMEENNKVTVNSAYGSFSVVDIGENSIGSSSEEMIFTKSVKLSDSSICHTYQHSKSVIATYKIDLPTDCELSYYIDAVQDDDCNDNAHVIASNAKGQVLGGFYAPTVSDDKGNIYQAEFLITDNQLAIISSVPRNGTYTATMATAALDYNHFYSKSEWNTRSDPNGYSLHLSVYTKVFAQWDFHTIAWQVLADRHRNDGITLQGIFRPYFMGNEEGLHDQWYCHLITIGHLKQPWNLEPGRPNVGLDKTISALCNPV